MDLLDMLSESSAQGRFYVEGKRMVTGGTTLDVTMPNEVRGKTKTHGTLMISHQQAARRAEASSGVVLDVQSTQVIAGTAA